MTRGAPCTQKVLNRCLRPALRPGWRHSPYSLIVCGADTPPQSTTPPRVPASRYRHLQRLISVNPLRNLFLLTALTGGPWGTTRPRPLSACHWDLPTSQSEKHQQQKRSKYVVAIRVFRSQNGQKCIVGQGSARDPAGRAYSAPQTP